MSYVIDDKNYLMLVKKLFNIYREEGMNIDLLEMFLNELIPKDNNGDILVGYRILLDGCRKPAFSLSENYIDLSIEGINFWLDNNSSFIMNKFDVKDMKLLKDYLFFYILCHEIEHSYQYLMAYDVIDSPCSLIRDSYRLIIDSIICRDYDKIGKLKVFRNRLTYYLYYKNDFKYVIERNANVESLDLMQMLAIENGHEEFSLMFNGMRNYFAMLGYFKDNNGCFDETMKDILLWNEYRKLEHDYELSNIDRFRCGLPISREYRNNIIDLMKIRVKK